MIRIQLKKDFAFEVVSYFKVAVLANDLILMDDDLCFECPLVLDIPSRADDLLMDLYVQDQMNVFLKKAPIVFCKKLGSGDFAIKIKKISGLTRINENQVEIVNVMFDVNKVKKQLPRKTRKIYGQTSTTKQGRSKGCTK